MINIDINRAVKFSSSCRSVRLSDYFTLLHLPSSLNVNFTAAFSLEVNGTKQLFRVPPLLRALRTFSESHICVSVVIRTPSSLHNTERQELICTAAHLWCVQGTSKMYGKFSNVGNVKLITKKKENNTTSYKLLFNGGKQVQLIFYKVQKTNYILYKFNFLRRSQNHVPKLSFNTSSHLPVRVLFNGKAINILVLFYSRKN